MTLNHGVQPRRAVLATPVAIHGGAHSLPQIGAPAPIVDFSVSLNAYGAAPAVLDAVLQAVSANSLGRYPDPGSHAAREAAASYWNRPIEELVFGAGAAELIHALCFSYLQQGDHVIVVQPAFGEYERAVQLCGAAALRVTLPLTDAVAEWESAIITLASTIQGVRPKLVFIASPTSPQGVQVPREVLQLLAQACERADCLLVIDQAYDAFTANPQGTPVLPGHSHVLHVRSITKDHALAGVRAGYAIASPAVASCIERVRVPWASSSVAQAAATASFTERSMEHVRRTSSELRTGALEIAAHCASLGFETLPSATHYVLMECGDGAAMQRQLLTTHRVLVRDCASFGLANYIRVAARTPHENALLVRALSDSAGTNRSR